MPLNVRPVPGVLFPVGGRNFDTGWIVVPGIVAGAAYASGDAMGSKFYLPVGCRQGFIQTVLVMDLDKEQLAFDLVLFGIDFTPTADNAAFVLNDNERHNYAGHINVTGSSFAAFSANAAATVTNINLPFVTPAEQLACQLVTRGVQNFTLATDLSVRVLGGVIEA